MEKNLDATTIEFGELFAGVWRIVSDLEEATVQRNRHSVRPVVRL
jgi:hypothetical protein